ncbi:MAG: putative toxin-antitoxin system toxin component, PIN family [Candidatus Humimicrobiaceae bacterium]
MKVVFDTNVFISAAILGRVCEEILNICRANKDKIEIFITNEIIKEIREKLENKFYAVKRESPPL